MEKDTVGYRAFNLKTIVGGDLLSGYFYTDFHISENNLQKIFDAIMRYGISKLNNAERYRHSEAGVSPNHYFDLVFHFNNETYTIYLDSTISAYLNTYVGISTGGIINHDNSTIQMVNLWSFLMFVDEFHRNTDEVNNFPEPFMIFR